MLFFFLTTVGGSFNSDPFWHLGVGLKLLKYFNNVYPTFYSNVRLFNE